MTLVEVLLILIVLILMVGLSLIVAIAYDLRENQNRGAALVLQYLGRHLGEPGDNEIVYTLRDLQSFLTRVREGRIPNLRNDDWYPTETDIRRWEHAYIMEAAER